MKSSEKLKLKRKVPGNKSNSRFSKGHFWENKMCQNSITCQSKLSFWVLKIKIGPLLSYFIFKCFISFKICQINYNLLTPISHPFHLTSFLRPDNLKRKLTVCTVEKLSYVCSVMSCLIVISAASFHNFVLWYVHVHRYS